MTVKEQVAHKRHQARARCKAKEEQRRTCSRAIQKRASPEEPGVSSDGVESDADAKIDAKFEAAIEGADAKVAEMSAGVEAAAKVDATIQSTDADKTAVKGMETVSESGSAASNSSVGGEATGLDRATQSENVSVAVRGCRTTTKLQRRVSVVG
jgi:hypothetical protein